MNWPLILGLIAWGFAVIAGAALLFGQNYRRPDPITRANADRPEGRWGWAVWPAGCVLAIAASCMWPAGFAP